MDLYNDIQNKIIKEKNREKKKQKEKKENKIKRLMKKNHMTYTLNDYSTLDTPIPTQTIRYNPPPPRQVNTNPKISEHCHGECPDKDREKSDINEKSHQKEKYQKIFIHEKFKNNFNLPKLHTRNWKKESERKRQKKEWKKNREKKKKKRGRET